MNEHELRSSRPSNVQPAPVECRPGGGERPSAFGVTDCGQQRDVNQDQFLIAQLNKSMLVRATSLPLDQQSRIFGGAQGQLLLVADGLGGHAAGEKASSLAVDYLIGRLLNRIHWFFQLEEDCEDEFVDDLKGLLRDAHARIVAESSDRHQQHPMGTTLTMAYIVWPRMYVVHAGDSRCYLVRGVRAEQLTTDHTLAHQMVEAGGLSPEDEANSRWSHVLWNVLGGQDGGELIAEVRRLDLQPRDSVVLCTDGLYRYVELERLASIVSESEDPQAVCSQLVQLANDAGGEDNITVVVARPQPGERYVPETTVEAEIPLDKMLGGAPDGAPFADTVLEEPPPER